MKLIALLPILCALALPAVSRAADIEIKGIRLGMTPAEVEQLGAQKETDDGAVYVLPGFTVGGASGKRSTGKGLNLIFDDGKLADTYFFFYPERFDDVVAAVRSKYPALKCVNSQVQNGAGAKYAQTECKLRGSKGLLEITRFVGDIETSYLGMKSSERVKSMANEERRRAKDI